MRKPFMAANWKMHKTIPEMKEFMSAFIPSIRDVNDVTVVIAPPFTALTRAAEQVRETNILLAAQNVSFEEKGAFTGEISAGMLIDAGCAYVIIGHSERRQYFRETDEVVNRKIRTAHRYDLGVIVCIGESLPEREADKTYEILQRQLEEGLKNVNPADVVIAYEPVWAIGTGRTAAPEQAQEAHAFIRGQLRSFYGNKADDLCILYGGSVTPQNAPSLMKCPDVDGALVGGASLGAGSFAEIVKYRKEL